MFYIKDRKNYFKYQGEKRCTCYIEHKIKTPIKLMEEGTFRKEFHPSNYENNQIKYFTKVSIFFIKVNKKR